MTGVLSNALWTASAALNERGYPQAAPDRNGANGDGRMGERLIELKGIAKTYGRVFAVGGVNFHVDRGEVVGLLGDNGAGKSTLIKMLAGAIEPTSGEILVRGKRETHWNAARSRDAGIETVFQDRALCVQQTITRNIFLGRELANPLGFLDGGRERAEAE